MRSKKVRTNIETKFFFRRSLWFSSRPGLKFLKCFRAETSPCDSLTSQVEAVCLIAERRIKTARCDNNGLFTLKGKKFYASFLWIGVNYLITACHSEEVG